MINGQIRDKEVRVIGTNGEQLGVMSARDAQKLADEAELDLIKIALRFRGREMAHISSSAHVLDDFAKMLEDIAQVSKAAKLEGRNMTMFLEKKR